MSLTKTLQQATGNDATYWQIAQVAISPRAKYLEIIVFGFKDKATFDSGGTSMGDYKISVNQDVLTDLGNTTLIPAVKTALQECQAVAKDIVSDLSDAVTDDTDII